MSISTGVSCSSHVYRYSTNSMFTVSRRINFCSHLTAGSPVLHQSNHRSITDHRFFRCKSLFNHPQPKPSTAGGTSHSRPGAASFRPDGNTSSSRGRGIGTDKNPIDLAYYDVLGVDSQCTTEEIKKAYRRMAIKVGQRPSRMGREGECAWA